MNFELTIRGDSFEEIATIFRGNSVRNQLNPPGMGRQVLGGDAQRSSDAKPETVAEETPAPKKSRGRKADTAKQDTQESTADPQDGAGPTATTDASPSDAQPVTFADLRAKTDEILQAGKVDSRAIQQMLIEKFDGAKAFGQVKEEDYARCLDELDKFAA